MILKKSINIFYIINIQFFLSGKIRNNGYFKLKILPYLYFIIQSFHCCNLTRDEYLKFNFFLIYIMIT
ncbi:MAG: hypothetical protein A2Z35_04890 [Actinobacteria bacterium RBG_19FT_COMBO_36_27]|nr:MAG: hypothetical protein A2Z35_04890 [Actinobacteria bacterium RBG_19FT_COMBO_36_27]